MARINNKGQLSGTIGAYAYRVANGQAIVQSKPGRDGVKQTEATKSSASEFGVANTTAKKIRTALFPILQHLADAKMHNRFAVKVYEALLGDTVSAKGSRNLAMGDLGVLEDFQFNCHSPFEKYADFEPKAHLAASGQVVLSLPEFNVREQLRFLDNATHCTICFLVTALDDTTFIESYSEVFKVPVSLETALVPAQEWTTSQLPANHLILVSVALFYYQENNLMGKIALNNKEVHPGKVVGVFRGGVVEIG